MSQKQLIGSRIVPLLTPGTPVALASAVAGSPTTAKVTVTWALAAVSGSPNIHAFLYGGVEPIAAEISGGNVVLTFSANVAVNGTLQVLAAPAAGVGFGSGRTAQQPDQIDIGQVGGDS